MVCLLNSPSPFTKIDLPSFVGLYKCCLSLCKVGLNSTNQNQNETKSNREEAVSIAKDKPRSSSSSQRKMRPALTPEARENQKISLAMDLAEPQLREGTAQ